MSSKTLRGKMKRDKDGNKVDQHGRSWTTAKTGRAPKNQRGRGHISLTDWVNGVSGGKYTNPKGSER